MFYKFTFSVIIFLNYFHLMGDSLLDPYMSDEEYLKFNKPGKVCHNEFTYNSKLNKNFLNIVELKELVKKNLSNIE